MVTRELAVRTRPGAQVPIPHLPGLDGIRGVAVLAVLAYHLDLWWAGGGFLGVEVFFTLSGFLITQLLVGELRRRGRVDLAAFVRARARRLLPALLACVLLTVAAYRVLLPAEAPDLRDDALSALLYLQNWHLVVAGIPYGADFAHPAPLLHLWSLAVEVQLYLCWALLLVGVLARLRRGTGVALTLALAAASAVAMARRYTPDGGTGVYYATDARASGFLLGAALALALSYRAWSSPLPRPASHTLDIAGGVAFVLLVVELVTASEFDGALYQQGGFLRTGLLAVVLIAAASRSEGRLRSLLASRVLGGIGRRSYGLYLYHWPVFALVRGAPDQGWVPDALALATTFVIAEVSYRWLETPVRRGAIRRLTRALRLRRRDLACVGGCAAVTVAALVAASTSPSVAPAAAAQDPHVGVAPAAVQPATPSRPVTPDPGAVVPGPPTRTLVIGDSIAIGSADALRVALGPDTAMQAQIGRQFAAAPGLVASWAATRGGPVVIELGANGTVQARDVDAALAAAGSCRVVLVGVAVPRRWRDGNNQMLRDAAARHAPHVVFVDWAALVSRHPGSIGPDRVHPTPDGRTLLASAVAEAVRR